MSERKINLEEIIKNEWKKYPDNYINPTSVAGALLLQNAIKNCMKESCKQILELAAENANLLNSKGEITGGISVDEYEDELSWRKIVVDYMVNKQSIVDTINKIE